jgi:anti-sigma B factor antagonist
MNFATVLLSCRGSVNTFSILLGQDQGERTHLGMTMQLNSELHGQDIIVVVAAPRIDAVQAIEFKEKFRNLVVGSEGRVVMDLSAVNFVDSSGLGAIVASMKALGGARKLELCGLQGNVEKVFRLTRLDSVFRVHPSAASARGSLGGAGTTSLAG